MEIQDKLCYVVIDRDTMERVSKFYSRKSDAKKYIEACSSPYNSRRYAIAEFEFKRYYVFGR